MTLGVGANLAADTRGVESLRAAAARDPRAAIKEAAKQFEALFMHELMKSMRQATSTSGLLDNPTTQLGTEMLDTQFAQQMTGLRGGLSEAIARHLERQLGVAVAPADGTPPASGDVPIPASAAPAPLRGVTPVAPPVVAPPMELSATQASFVRQHAQAARAAQESSGIPAHFMLAQAAHETGWGQREIRNADGGSANNLFGIKAGPNWKGAVATSLTTEYIDGQPHKVRATFRAYASAAESFADYAKLIGGNPRYAAAHEVLAQGGSAQSSSAQRFATELQRAGYATDPQYADKLTRTINTLLRARLAVG